jgi:hypothetical protein
VGAPLSDMGRSTKSHPAVRAGATSSDAGTAAVMSVLSGPASRTGGEPDARVLAGLVGQLRGTPAAAVSTVEPRSAASVSAHVCSTGLVSLARLSSTSARFTQGTMVLYVNALKPVMSRPTISACMVSVPS